MFSLYDTKELRLPDGSFINYKLIKKYRRTVSLKITPQYMRHLEQVKAGVTTQTCSLQVRC